MIKYENECCDCAVPAYPCVGDSCPYINVPHYYCDECGVEGDSDNPLYKYDGKDLCVECILNKFEKTI